MKNNFVITIILIIILIGTVLFLLPKSKNGSLVNPIGNLLQQPSQAPQVSNYNPPKEVKYDSSTDLKQKLDSINPKVLDSDFEQLKNP